MTQARGEGATRLEQSGRDAVGSLRQQPFRQVKALLQFGEPLVDEVELFLAAGNIVLETLLLPLRALLAVPQDDAAPGRHDDEAVHECPREQLDRHSGSTMQRTAWVRFDSRNRFRFGGFQDRCLKPLGHHAWLGKLRPRCHFGSGAFVRPG